MLGISREGRFDELQSDKTRDESRATKEGVERKGVVYDQGAGRSIGWLPGGGARDQQAEQAGQADGRLARSLARSQAGRESSREKGQRSACQQRWRDI